MAVLRSSFETDRAYGSFRFLRVEGENWERLSSGNIKLMQFFVVLPKR